MITSDEVGDKSNILEENAEVRQVQEDDRLLLELEEPVLVPEATPDAGQVDAVSLGMKKVGKKTSVVAKMIKKEPTKKKGLAAVAGSKSAIG